MPGPRTTQCTWRNDLFPEGTGFLAEPPTGGSLKARGSRVEPLSVSADVGSHVVYRVEYSSGISIERERFEGGGR